MPAKKYVVKLTPEQREQLERVVSSNKTSIRQRTHARILLAADAQQAAGAASDEVICRLGRTSLSTVGRVRARFVEVGLEGALCHKPQAKRKARVLDGVAEAHVIALVCSAPPEGHQRWGLHLLKDKLSEMHLMHLTESVSHETVRQRLKKSVKLGFLTSSTI